MTCVRQRTRMAVTVDEAAYLTSLSRSCIYNMLNSGRILGRRIGRRTMIEITELQRFISELPYYYRITPVRQRVRPTENVN